MKIVSIKKQEGSFHPAIGDLFRVLISNQEAFNISTDSFLSEYPEVRKESSEEIDKAILNLVGQEFKEELI